MDHLELIDVADELREAHEAHHVIRRNPKIYLERVNPLDIYGDEQFRSRYRMRKQVAEYIINLVRDEILIRGSYRGCPVARETQVLATVRYLSKGAYEEDVAEQHGLSQPTLSTIIRRVVQAIARHVNEFIKFPQNEEANRVKGEFYSIAHCPNVIGAIDCTHIKIKNPGGENPLSYLNRKGFYSLNVQVVSDSVCRVRNIVARWRGSTHDSRIWNESLLYRKFQNGEVDGILLGDNGYPCSKYLLTPLLNPQTNAEQYYNRAHISTRNVVERTFGIMKNKFRCFFNGLNLQLETTKAAIVAIAIIHNIIIDDRIANGDQSDDEFQDNNENFENEAGNIQGNVFRQQYIQRYFN